MAMMKSPSKGDIMASLVKSIMDLKNEKNPKLHSTIYETLTQLVMKTHVKPEAYDSALHSVALPIALQDITFGNESLMIAALVFLGGLLQVVKLSQENQNSVIEVLTSKLSNVAEKNQSRRLMWSLANIQLDSQLQESSLEKVLQAAFKFLNEKPPVLSLSTVCESLNTLKNLGARHNEFLEKHLSEVLLAVLPWLFNEADRIRELSLACLEPFTGYIAEHRLLDVSFQNLLRGKHYNILSQLVLAESADSLKLWSFLIQAFGTQLHDSVALLNELLKIEESALKCKNPVFRQRALEHWKYIIESFALNPNVLNNSKRIKLILVPLKSTDTRTVDFSKTKIELWWHLLYKLGPDAVIRFQEVTLPLLTFCFGAQDDKQQNKGTALIFSNILPLAMSVFAGVISQQTCFEASPMEGVILLRSHPFLSSEDFCSTVDNFSQLTLLTLNLKTGTDLAESYEIIIRSFIERCCSANLIEPLKIFICSLLATVTTKPELMEVVFDVLAKSFQFDLVPEVLTSNMDCLLLWFVENEPLPAHPLVRFLTKFFEAGTTWNVELFTASVTQTLVAVNDKQEQKNVSDNSSVAELWSKFATALITKSHSIHVPSAHRQSLLLPLTWSWIESDESIFLPWSTLLSTWARADPSILAVVLNPLELKEVEVEEGVVRAVLSALRSELSSYSTEMSSWINRWITSWMKLADVPENLSKCADILAKFLCAIIDELKLEGNVDDFLGKVKTSLQDMTLSKEVKEILQGVFGPVSSALKTTSVQKLRQHSNICKLFSPLLPRNASLRNKQKPKFFDDFVIVPPVEKKRVLTEHQKEVMRSKRRASCVPAMYNDLSNSSQQSSSMDTQPRDTSVPIITSCFSLKEENAFLEPPISLQQAEVLNELPMVDNGNQIEEILNKDQKLRSKVSVQVSQLSIKRRSARLSSPSLDNSSVSSSESASLSPVQDNILFQRPGPASKKAGFGLRKQPFKKVKAAEISKSIEQEVATVPEQDNLIENHDKENGLLVSQPSHTLTFTSPRRVTLCAVEQEEEPSASLVDVPSQIEVVPETQENQGKEIENSAPEVVNLSDDELDQSSLTNSSHSQTMAKELDADSDKLIVDTNQTEDAKQTTLEVSVCSVDESTSASPTEKIEDQPSNHESTDKIEPEIIQATPEVVVQSTEIVNIEEASSSIIEQQKTQDEIPTVKVENSDICSEPVQPETLQQKAPSILYKNYIKSFCLRSKRTVTPKSTGPSPSTGKRGAQILELSRKIQSEPPNKKSKMKDSPQKDTADPTVGELVLTPEGSPARTSPWLPRTYSPYASPSTGILKKRSLIEESEDAGEASYSPVSSASKSRRVSFADPEVSHSVKISPIKKRLSRTRTRRSLITTYENSSFIEEPIEMVEKSAILDSNENNLQPSEKSSIDQICSSEDARARMDETIESVVENSSATSNPTDQQNDVCSVSEEPSQVLRCDEAQIDPQEQHTDISEVAQTSIYPAAIDCNDSLALIVDRVTSATSRGPIMAVLEKLGVRSIGDFCALSEADIQGLDFHLPQHETIKQFLERHFAKKLSERPITHVNAESQRLSDSSLPNTNDVSNLPTSSHEIMTVELVESSGDSTKESSKSPDPTPDGQIITDSPEVPFSYLSDNKGSDLENPDIEDGSSGSEDVAIKSHSGSEAVQNPDKNTVDAYLNLSADEIINIIERHPQKDNILSIVMRKYVSLCFTVNGKVFPLPT